MPLLLPLACAGDEEEGSATASVGIDGIITLGGQTLGGQTSTGTGEDTSTTSDLSSDSESGESGENGETTGLVEEECETNLIGAFRDFQSSHPDFESAIGQETGIVADRLGDDQKPVYAGGAGTLTTTGAVNFDQWYNDSPGINRPLVAEILLTDNGMGSYVFDSSAFFPIDGEGFGDEGNPHNFHFTLEIHTRFKYEGGEVFSFTGDDDLFVFVNGNLAIDLGGVHGALNGSVDMDAQAASLGIEVGSEYTLDFFFAERHTVESNFHIETTIDCFEFVPIP